MKKLFNLDKAKETITNKLKTKNNRKKSNSFIDRVVFIVPAFILIIAVIVTVVHSIAPKQEETHISQQLYDAYGNEDTFKNRVYGESQTPNMENEPTPSNEELPISVYGDSYCISSDSIIPSMPAYLSKAANSRLVYNVAAPKDTIEIVAARTGGVSMYVSPCDIKGDKDDIEIILSNKYGTNIVPDFSKNAGLNPCKINGIEGVISKNNDKLYFTRSESGFEEIITSPTKVVTRAMDLRLDDITVIFVGSDKLYSNMDRVNEIYESIVNNLGSDKYLIVGPVYGDSNTIQNANTALEAKFGKKFFNLFDYLCSDAVKNSESIVLSEDEITNADNRVQIPESLLSNDKEYFTEIGNQIAGEAIADKIKDLGYLS